MASKLCYVKHFIFNIYVFSYYHLQYTSLFYPYMVRGQDVERQPRRESYSWSSFSAVLYKLILYIQNRGYAIKIHIIVNISFTRTFST